VRDGSDEAGLAAELRRHRMAAGACLGAAAAGWALSHAGVLPPGAALPLRAVAEAGMIGGLADWFAVTALFRHPLGLPVPHTALVPRNRDRIADGIAGYIDREFLEPGMLVGQLRRVDPAGRIARALEEEESRRRLAGFLAGLVPGLLKGQEEHELRDALVRAVTEGIAGVDLRAASARVLRGLVESPQMETLILELSDQAVAFVHNKRGWIEEAVTEKSRWWVPSAIDRKLADQLAEAVTAHLWDLRYKHTDPGRKLRLWLSGLPERVETMDGLGEKLSAALRAALNHEALAPLVRNLLRTLRAMAEEDLAKPDGSLRKGVAAAVASLSEQLRDDSLRERVNRGIEEAFAASVPGLRQEIRGFVSDTLRGQDVQDFTDRLELRVGKDLQYIRINGTLLGALIGGVLYVLNGLLTP